MMQDTYETAVITLWPHCYPFLEPAIEMMDGLHCGASVLGMILERRAELWPGKASAIVTELVDYPHGRSLHFWLAGGDLEELKTMEPEILAWGRARGCSHATISGRRGWLRKLDGYHEAATLMTKRIDE
jgi:hypothetical protein